MTVSDFIIDKEEVEHKTGTWRTPVSFRMTWSMGKLHLVVLWVNEISIRMQRGSWPMRYPHGVPSGEIFSLDI